MTYLRWAALGDSSTVGLGDPTPDGCRGWSRLLAAALADHHDLSYVNLAVTGATARTVREVQLDPAVAHHPDVVSLLVGINDCLRSTWSAPTFRADLAHCARQFATGEATLLLATLPTRTGLPLPSRLADKLAERLRTVNDIVLDLGDQLESAIVVRLDAMDALPAAEARRLWSVDRLHPCEIGHRRIAAACAAVLTDHDYPVSPISLEPDGLASPLADAAWLLTQATPWVGRRARDLLPGAARAGVGRLIGRATLADRRSLRIGR